MYADFDTTRCHRVGGEAGTGADDAVAADDCAWMAETPGHEAGRIRACSQQAPRRVVASRRDVGNSLVGAQQLRHYIETAQHKRITERSCGLDLIDEAEQLRRIHQIVQVILYFAAVPPCADDDQRLHHPSSFCARESASTTYSMSSLVIRV